MSTPEIAPPDVVFYVCFYLALGGAASVLRSFLSRGDPAQGTQREGGRDRRIQGRGSPREGETQNHGSHGDLETQRQGG